MFGPTSTSGLFLTIPHPSMGYPWTIAFIKNGPKHQTHNMLLIHQGITLQTISHGQSWSNKQSGLFLTISNRVVGCLWAALSPSIGSTLWNRESMAISGLTHQLQFACYLTSSKMHNYNTSHLNNPWTVQNGSQISSILVPSFGTDQTATYDLISIKPLTRLLNRK